MLNHFFLFFNLSQSVKDSGTIGQILWQLCGELSHSICSDKEFYSKRLQKINKNNKFNLT